MWFPGNVSILSLLQKDCTVSALTAGPVVWLWMVSALWKQTHCQLLGLWWCHWVYAMYNILQCRMPGITPLQNGSQIPVRAACSLWMPHECRGSQPSSRELCLWTVVVLTAWAAAGHMACLLPTRQALLWDWHLWVCSCQCTTDATALSGSGWWKAVFSYFSETILLHSLI